MLTAPILECPPIRRVEPLRFRAVVSAAPRCDPYHWFGGGLHITPIRRQRGSARNRLHYQPSPAPFALSFPAFSVGSRSDVSARPRTPLPFVIDTAPARRFVQEF